MIFHHKAVSPYSEKIRTMLGYCQISWLSVEAPLIPPRPSIDPLAGGYRRIPVAQLGADVFCDTNIIADEIASLAGNKRLSPYHQSSEKHQFIAMCENAAFSAGVISVPVCGLIKALLQQIPLKEIPAYLNDKKRIAADAKLETLS